MKNIYTDLAKEAVELHDGQQIEGVRTREYRLSQHICVSRVEVLDRAGAQALQKEKGTYLTIECALLHTGTVEIKKALVEALRDELAGMLPKSPCVLVVGLGNRNITPDSLGPRVCEKLFVTRHIREYLPELITNSDTGVCALAPGVLGMTGIETQEIIRGVVERVHPDLVIAVDALAARSVSRIATSIQLADAGIAPGAGIGNRRQALNQQELGVPVLALGVPRVVFASTIAYELTEHAVLASDLPKRSKERLFDTMQEMEGNDLIVTPKEIDTMIETVSEVLAESLNLALHPKMTPQEIHALMS